MASGLFLITLHLPVFCQDSDYQQFKPFLHGPCGHVEGAMVELFLGKHLSASWIMRYCVISVTSKYPYVCANTHIFTWKVVKYGFNFKSFILKMGLCSVHCFERHFFCLIGSITGCLTVAPDPWITAIVVYSWGWHFHRPSPESPPSWWWHRYLVRWTSKETIVFSTPDFMVT